MTIGIDCRLSGARHAGIGRYILNLISRYPKLDKTTKFVLFFDDQDQVTEAKLDNYPNVTCVMTHVSHYSLLEQIKLPFIFSKYNLDLLHVPHFNLPIFYFGKTVITIHDLLWHQQRGQGVTTLSSWKYYIKYLGYLLVSSIAVLKAKKIIVPTQTIKNTLINFYPFVKNKVIVTTEGIDSSLLKTGHRKLDTGNYLLYVGSLYPHKNISLVLKGLQKLPKLKLKIVGSRNIFVDKVKKHVEQLGLTDQVEFLGFVEDQQLHHLYAQSLALVQPSLSEGFGLTGIEAMACGGLVLASDIPVFREVYAEHAFYFDPQKVNSFLEAVAKLEHLDRAKTQKSNISYSKKFDWDNTAEQTLAVYHQVID